MHFRFVEGFSFTFCYGYCSLRALPQASAQSVTVSFLNYLCLTVYYLEGAFCAFGDAISASVAEIFVYFYDFSFYHSSFLLLGIFRPISRILERGFRWLQRWALVFFG